MIKCRQFRTIQKWNSTGLFILQNKNLKTVNMEVQCTGYASKEIYFDTSDFSNWFIVENRKGMLL